MEKEGKKSEGNYVRDVGSKISEKVEVYERVIGDLSAKVGTKNLYETTKEDVNVLINLWEEL